MVLAACRECNKKISTEAKVCIGCGAPYPTSKAKEINDNLDYFILLKNYYNKFINGKISLPISFWLVGLIGIMVVSLLITLLLYFFDIFNNPLLRILGFPYLIIASIAQLVSCKRLIIARFLVRVQVEAPIIRSIGRAVKAMDC